MNIAVLDLETDPFTPGKMIQPFVSGFYDGSRKVTFWGDDCVARMVRFLKKEETPWTIYAHNGGRFDWFYFLKYMEDKMRIVNARVIQAFMGKHELRDSFSIMPFALEKYKKTEIDYGKFTRRRREHHKAEILSYLGDDLRDLHDLCSAYYKEFGDQLTIGGSAMKQLKKFHSFEVGNAQYDKVFRERYYFGGRSQTFKVGVFRGPIKIYDVNSMYPYVMRESLHPVSSTPIFAKRITESTCFLTVRGINLGAFPVRAKHGALDFTQKEGIFYPTIHEYTTALETGTFKPTKLIETVGFDARITFDEFVDHFYNARLRAKADNDQIRTLFYKFVLNSGYGKFAQNPENYADYIILPFGTKPGAWHDCDKSCLEVCKLRWCPTWIDHNTKYIIWARPTLEQRYYNIATGASITGAARAQLLKGITRAKDLYYCDTDSLICSNLRGVSNSPTDLGAWKVEETGDSVAVAGKKLYAVFRGRQCVKKAHKGSQLTGAQIKAIARGAEISYSKPAPSFKWDGTHRFITRTIRRTA